MICLSDGNTFVRRCHVVGGSGRYAYFASPTRKDEMHEVVLEDELRIHDRLLVGFHFKLSDGSDWVVVRGAAAKPKPELLADLEAKLGLKRTQPDLEED